MIDFVTEYLGRIIIFASGGLASFGLAFISPFATQWMTKRFARKPAFSVSSARLGTDLLLEVRPLNALATKKRSLNVRVNGANLASVADFRETERGLEWIVDFTPPHIRAALMHSEQCAISFFFDADLMSEPTSIKRPIEPFDNERKKVKQTDTVQELLYALESNTKVYTFFEAGNVGRQFPLKTASVDWAGALDGKEIVISGINNLEISGSRTKILQSSRYAWVLTFKNCNGLSLDNLIVGHEFEGYCLGGVLRFEDCSDVHIKNSDLFGCGTYALEFERCRNIEVSNTTLRDCSYGIANIHDTENLVFSDCRFVNNKEFNLINTKGRSECITFQRCVFAGNMSSGYLFHFADEFDKPINFYVWYCKFENNKILALSNREESFSIYSADES